MKSDLTVDVMAWDREGWISGLRIFIHSARAAAERAEGESRKRLLSIWGGDPWEGNDDVRFHWRIPQFATYGAVVLTYSLVETQLGEYATRLYRDRSLPFSPQDIGLEGLLKLRIYFEKVARIPTDLNWDRVSALSRLRNAIVHRRGRRGDKKKARKLLRDFPGILLIDEDKDQTAELLIPWEVCTQIVDDIEGFFARFCEAAGLPQKGLPDLPELGEG